MKSSNGMSKTKTVFVGLSGGVDSSVAALRLKNRGFNVVGVFIKVWHPDWLVCNWEQERLDAMRVAAHLGIPFLTCDAEAAYRAGVAEYFVNEHKAGRTPNPDVMCNQQVKFGAFLTFAKEYNADYIATGHYAQRIETSDVPELHRGVDTQKDQTYFLWTLTNEQLAHSLFPVGDTQKAKIRAEAEAAGIPVAEKKDSQGICFLGHIDIAEFLKHYIELVPGDVLDTAGNIIGAHHGALTYTLGQRHGFDVTTTDAKRPGMFVVAKDITKNTITVDTQPAEIAADHTFSLHSTVLRAAIASGDTLEVQFRYRQKPLDAEVISARDRKIVMRLTATAESPAAGQSCVLYRGSHCLGGGIIG
ncbi:tRNA 2-thiouridine(34) synthase MnmA [bacterium]|nr:tRNA 2-thiouridine(34) synthase MnmA [bacterium]